jgi:DNA-binding response OmpR family regulator
MTIAGKLVLILEDEPIVGLALEDMIDEAGGRSVYAERIEQALELVASEPLDAAILDINLHGKQSYPVAAALASRGVVYIFATGYGDTVHPDEFAEVPTVAKPYSFADLEKALQRAGPAR